MFKAQRSMIRGCACLALLLTAAVAAAQPRRDKAALAETQVALKRAAIKAAEAQVDIAKAKLEAGKANIARARATLVFEKANLDRLKRLVESKAVDETSLRAAEKNYLAAEAQLRAAEAEVAAGQAEVVRESARREMALAELAEVELRAQQIQRPGRAAAEDNAQIKALLKERHDALHKVVEMGFARVKVGGATFASLTHPLRDALRATLDLSDGDEQRIASLEKLEKIAAAITREEEDRFKAGSGPETDVLRARAVNLEVRIALLREQAKTKGRKSR